MAKVSIIIPARNEIYLQRTISSVLAAARGDIEVIAVCDGYWPDPPIQDDPRVILIHHAEAKGQRQSINEAARIATGKYIMKLDAHCAVADGFDTALAADCEYDWTVIPRMYNLDHETWQPKLHKRTDYMYIGWNEKNELRSLYYSGDGWKTQHAREELVDDTMGCMGPCFFMHLERFWELGGCDENHGSWGQQGIEVALKAWLSGGALKVNKKTWFAHWFRGGGGPGFPYQITGRDVDTARKYSMDLWLNDKWPQAKRPLSWLVEKFNPPGWDKRPIWSKAYRIMTRQRHISPTSSASSSPIDNAPPFVWPLEPNAKIDYPVIQPPALPDRDELQRIHYRHVHLKGHDPKWRGIKVIKLPEDFLLYQQAIWENKPDYIVEIGSAYGGSALFFADMIGPQGHVITIDPNPRGPLPEHSNITWFRGDSKSPEIIAQIKQIVGPGSVMVSIDGNHKRQQVKWELKLYADIVTSGQYMVVEDCYGRACELVGPGQARDWFLKWNKDFRQTDFDRKYLVGFTRGGWLKKK